MFAGKGENNDSFCLGIQGRGVSGALLISTFSVSGETDISKCTTVHSLLIMKETVFTILPIDSSRFGILPLA